MGQQSPQKTQSPPEPFMRFFTRWPLTLAAALATFGAPLHAQARPTTTQDDDESHQVPPSIATGVTVGAMRFAGGRTENALSVILMYRPMPWLSLSTAPGFARTSFGSTSATGLTDIPFNAAAAHGFEDARWSPSIEGGLSATLSPGDTSSALGVGRSALEGSAAFSVSPTDRLGFSFGLSHPLTSGSGNGSINLESTTSFGRTTGSFGLSAETGKPDSAAVLSRSLAAGVAYSISGPLTLTVDAIHGISGSAPTWGMSIGIGTAFAGVSQMNPSSALKRLKSTLGSKTTGTSGFAKTSGASSCKRAGTC